MARYVTLLKFTDQGAKGIKKSAARAAAFQKEAARSGVKIETQLWTVGSCDGLMILSAASEAAALKAVAKLGSMGNVRTETLRAFDAREFAAMVGK